MPGATSRRSPGKRPGQRLTFERLEDRLTPATELISLDFGNSVGLPTGAEVVGSSSDGRYVIFQSSSPNVVRNQVNPIPGAMNLFWQDTVTGERHMVSAERGSKGLRAAGIVPSIPGQNATAVISADGKSVAFTSTRNANAYDNFVAFPSTGVFLDNGDVSPDIFYWNLDFIRAAVVSTDPLNPNLGLDFRPLVSATINTQLVDLVIYGEACGYLTSATNPAISADGKYVSFVSKRDTQAFNIVISDNGDNTPDLFVRNINSLTAVGGVVLFTAFTATPVSIFQEAGFGIPDAFGLFSGTLEVDPFGRYMSSDGKSFVFLSSLSPDRINPFVLPSPPGSIEVYQAAFNPNVITGDPAISLVTSAPGQPFVSVGAQAFNAIIPRENSNGVVFSAVVPGGPTGSLVPNYKNLNGGGAELYYREVSLSNNITQPTLLSPTVLVSSQFGNPSVGANGQLDLSPGSFAVDSKGRQIAFTSKATNLAFGVTDTNDSFDIFARDIATGVTQAISVTPSGKSTGNGVSSSPRVDDRGFNIAFLSTSTNLAAGVTDLNGTTDVFLRNVAKNRTDVVSVAGGGAFTANGPSSGVIINGTQTGGFVFFNSKATNLINGVQPSGLVPLVYAVSYPIGGQGLDRIVAVSGGQSGQAALATFSATGALVTGAPTVPFPNFRGEVRSASADVNGDGIPDLIVGAGPGAGPQVKVFDGASGALIYSFFPFEASFTGGVFVAGGDFTGDGFDDIIVGAGSGGGPRVKIFSGATGDLITDLFVYEAGFRGGVRVAAGDINGDGIDDLVVGAGIGGGPRVQVFNGAGIPFGNLVTLLNFYAFEPSLRNGVYVAAGDTNGDGFADLAVGAGPGGGPRVIVFDSLRLLNPVVGQTDRLADFFAFPEPLRDGVRVALRNVDGSSRGGLVTGIGGGGPEVRTFQIFPQSATGVPTLLSQQFAFGETAGLFGAWVG